MATMATYPPLTPPCDLPVYLLPNNIFGSDDMETSNLLEQYWFYDDQLPDFSAITDIPMTNGVERYTEHTDLDAIQPSAFQKPPTPEPESSPTPKPEVIETRIKQERSNEAVRIGIEEDEKLAYEKTELASLEGMPHQKQQQQQQQQQQKKQFQGWREFSFSKERLLHFFFID